MIKKITFGLLFCCMIFSCGKKADPEYKTFNKILIQAVLLNKA